MAATQLYNLPLIDENNTADVPRDFNALSQAVDKAISEAVNGIEVTPESIGAASKNEFDAHIADLTSHVPYVVAGGTANVYTASITTPLTGYVDGMALAVKINNANTGASSINVNGWGAKPIKRSNGSDMLNDMLKVGLVYTLRYSGTAFILQGEGGEYGTAQAQHVIRPYTIGTDSGLVEGSLLDFRTSNVSVSSSKIKEVDGLNKTIQIAPGSSAGIGPDTTFAAKVDNLSPDNVKHGVKVGNSAATDPKQYMTGTYTSDGSIAADSVLNARVGYTQGQRVVGNIQHRYVGGGAGQAKAHYDTTAPAESGAFSDDGKIYAYLQAASTARICYDGGTFIRSAQPDLVPSNILAGKNIMGTAGNIPVLSGVRNAQGTARWGDGALAVYTERGYQSGGAGGGEIKVTPAQLQAAEGGLRPQYIQSGIGIFGITGTLQPRLYAEGTTTAYQSSVSADYKLIKATNLGFRPKAVFAIRSDLNSDYTAMASEFQRFADNRSYAVYFYTDTTSGQPRTARGASTGTLFDYGFEFTVHYRQYSTEGTGVEYKWYAYG